MCYNKGTIFYERLKKKMEEAIASLKKYCTAFDEFAWIVKVIFCIPALHIVWAIYRVSRSIIAKNTVGIIVSAILAFVPVMWLVDLVCLLFNGKLWTMD